ncbi:OTU domain-containing protein 1-like isoform X3 [Prorops nasuta]|uniref:OTU domain-containing protein 1-like isoform X3 n=1 Tax=Prorops nasuta TaxID=863751 RepID=UPI0034CF05AD
MINLIKQETFNRPSRTATSLSHLDGKHWSDKGDIDSYSTSYFPLKISGASYRGICAAQTDHHIRSSEKYDRVGSEWKSKPLPILKKGTALYRCSEGTFRVHKIFGDGNCMFRAISHILWGNEDEHRSLRTIVVQHIQENWREYSPFVMAEWSISDPQSYHDFMSSVGTFASELECTVATKIYKRNLSIYREINGKEELKRVFCNHISPRYQTARLLFSGQAESGHYDVLLHI